MRRTSAGSFQSLDSTATANVSRECPASRRTAADLANIAASVAAQTSGYLYAHPDLNAFYTDLHNKPDDEVPAAVRSYFDSNPQAHSDLLGIRQPLTDFRTRCGLPEAEHPLLGQ